jgi:nitrite reductase/ring-hydroxylating ferredoxin subunit
LTHPVASGRLGTDEDASMNLRESRAAETEPVDMTRRDVLRGSLGLAGLSPLCCSTPEVSPESVHFEGLTLIVDLNGAPELRRVGSAGAIVDAGRDVNILVACTEKGRYVVLDRTCTHGGAQCAYNHERRTLQCTSLNHAEYGLDGTLLHGRTHGNLRAYETRRSASRLEIRLRPRT